MCASNTTNASTAEIERPNAIGLYIIDAIDMFVQAGIPYLVLPVKCNPGDEKGIVVAQGRWDDAENKFKPSSDDIKERVVLAVPEWSEAEVISLVADANVKDVKTKAQKKRDSLKNRHLRDA